MIRVEIPKDINEYKAEFALGFTARQILCLVAVLVMAIPTFFIMNKFVDTSGIVYVIIIEALIPMLIGFYQVDGRPFESFLKIVINYYTCPTKRKYIWKSHTNEIHLEIKQSLFQIECMERKINLKEEKLADKVKARESRKKRKTERTENSKSKKAR